MALLIILYVLKFFINKTNLQHTNDVRTYKGRGRWMLH